MLALALFAVSESHRLRFACELCGQIWVERARVAVRQRDVPRTCPRNLSANCCFACGLEKKLPPRAPIPTHNNTYPFMPICKYQCVHTYLRTRRHIRHECMHAESEVHTCQHVPIQTNLHQSAGAIMNKHIVLHDVCMECTRDAYCNLCNLLCCVVKLCNLM